MNIALSVVIPVYNEEECLAALFARLYPALDAIAARGESYEIIFINDGSRDRSAALLREQFQQLQLQAILVERIKCSGQHPELESAPRDAFNAENPSQTDAEG